MPPVAVPERRLAASGLNVETRADGQRVLVGYAAVFYRAGDPGTEYELYDGCVERIMPGAFDRAIREDDVRALFNHEEECILGRTKSGTCRLSVDDKGLKFEVDVPNTTIGRDVVEVVSRGDISGCSFAFIPERVVWTEETSMSVRQIESVKLLDVGPVTYPAYEATEVMARSVEHVKAEVDAMHAEKRKAKDADAISVTLARLALDEERI